MASIDSLVCEVSPFLESSYALKAAQQLFFGDRLLYGECSNMGPSSSKDIVTPPKGSSGKEEKKPKKEKEGKGAQKTKPDSLESAISNAKKAIQNVLHGEKGDQCHVSAGIEDLRKEVENLKLENVKLRKVVDELNGTVQQVLAKIQIIHPVESAEQLPGKTEDKKSEDFDLFGSSDEEVDEEKERIKQERLKAYAEKKAKKPVSVAKSSVILDVKPWDDETDMAEMEKKVREMDRDGLVWGGSKLIPLAYGLKKLQIICVIEDEKVSVDDLIENIVEEVSEHVQSVDIVAFNKI